MTGGRPAGTGRRWRGIGRTSAVLVLGVVLTLTACTTEKEQTMTPIEARDRLTELITGTMDAAQTSGWVVQQPSPTSCAAGDEQGVSFGAGAYTPTLGADAAADARRVADYWTSLGISARIVDEPTPRVFGSGGPVDAISFSTLPTYAIDAGGACVPGDPSESYGSSTPGDG